MATAGTFVLWKFEPYRIVVGSLTILVSALNAVLTFTNSSKRAATHVSAGNCYNDLRNRSRLFSEIEVNSEPYEKSLEKLRCLCIERNELNSRFPQIPKWAFNKARKGIEEGEARYKVGLLAREFLVSELRRRIFQGLEYGRDKKPRDGFCVVGKRETLPLEKSVAVDKASEKYSLN